MRFEQNWLHPSGITSFLTIDGQLTLHASTRASPGKLIYSAANATVLAGKWNHSLVGMNMSTSECTMTRNGLFEVTTHFTSGEVKKLTGDPPAPEPHGREKSN